MNVNINNSGSPERPQCDQPSPANMIERLQG